ncbi:Scr1 family TA system antitoxin-like transcriptional regulator [Glycomyces buryatensis]|uniref:Helix-turn-helix domain-containing protein n=1 Tax=Glycomyces buryatensis TaxID=2570927 RepID=A0A4S8PR40_9ACTN|nr:Scr1 family TA system antitoxin-like transcriptional regulator [Glycomyces buryatensis]THV33680.1 helix-turn-helix domain-containing protein [Glycomyces buryatensis]
MSADDLTALYKRLMLRKYRILAGLSQERLADQIFVHRDTVRFWENGRHNIPYGSISDIAEACGMDDELKRYMKLLTRNQKKDGPIETDLRLNALMVAMGEEYYGEIFKWDALIIPGPLQTERYHFEFVRLTEPGASDEDVAGGWVFKVTRRETLEERTDNFIAQFLIGEAALVLLRHLSEELYREQIAHLRACVEEFGWEIRVFPKPVRAREGNLNIFKIGESGLVGPNYVYLEHFDTSKCIEDPAVVQGYDDFRKSMWKMSNRIEDDRYDL